MEIKNKKFHFIAAGGVGMSALAKFLKEKGAYVSGSDISESRYTRMLNEIGVEINIGHDAGLIKKDMIITASSAVKKNNPELLRAEELNLKIYHRSDILKMISDEYSNNPDAFFIGFSGTHGKTTTSGLCAYLLEKAGYNPSYVIGGMIPDINTNGRYAAGSYFTAELDESDGTIAKYASDTAVINNLEEDHLDYYVNGFKDIAETFNKYLSNKPEQKVIINADDKGCRKFTELYPDYNYITFGLDKADYTAENIKQDGFNSSFDIYKNGKLYTSGINLIIAGRHNIYNALAVSAALIESGADISRIKEHFASFKGMGRRLQKSAEFGGITVYDDYAHHPGEIRAVMSALKSALKDDGRIIAVFQPHRYTRFKSFRQDFKKVFEEVPADMLFVTDIYSAGEDADLDISSELFAKDFNRQNVRYIKGSIPEAADAVLPFLKPDDTVITLGAGTITKLGACLKEEYLQRNAEL